MSSKLPQEKALLGIVFKWITFTQMVAGVQLQFQIKKQLIKFTLIKTLQMRSN